MSAVGRSARRAAKKVTKAASTGANWLQEGAGNAAAVAQAGIDAGESWIDEGADTIWDWLHGEEQTPIRNGSPNERRSPQGDPVETPERPREEAGYYLDQRDNDTETTSGGVAKSGDVQCTPTSTAMVLLGLCGEAAFRSKAETLFIERGVNNGAQWFQDAAPEEIVWDYIYARSTAEWFALVAVNVGTQPHIHSCVQASLIEEFSGASVAVTSGGSGSGPGSYQSNLEQISRFPAVAGTHMTSAGHTVTVVSVHSEGVVVHDPYGAYGTCGHLRNGETGQAPPRHRWKYNTGLLGSDTVNDAHTNWGESNFFTWSEVADLGIGKWIAGAENTRTSV